MFKTAAKKKKIGLESTIWFQPSGSREKHEATNKNALILLFLNLIPNSLSIPIPEFSLVLIWGNQIDPTSESQAFPSPKLSSVPSSRNRIDQTSETQFFPSLELSSVTKYFGFLVFGRNVKKLFWNARNIILPSEWHSTMWHSFSFGPEIFRTFLLWEFSSFVDLSLSKILTLKWLPFIRWKPWVKLRH